MSMMTMTRRSSLPALVDESVLRGFPMLGCERRGSDGNIENLYPTSYMMSTVTVAISRDHREVANYYKEILNATDNDTATRWQNQFTWALTRHLVAEEIVLYPAFESILGERGRIIVDRGKFEHQDVSYLKLFSYFAGLYSY
jgi:hypothetical protein